MEGFTELCVWGGDQSGQLGLGGTEATVATPVPCRVHLHIQHIACGEEHSAFVTDNGHVYVMGSNKEGKLGIGASQLDVVRTPVLVDSLTAVKIVKVACGRNHSMALSASGQAFTWGSGEYGALGIGSVDSQSFPLQVALESMVVDVDCGARHSAFLTDKQRVFVCGDGEAGQLGTGRRAKEVFPVKIGLENLKQVACGVFHTGFLTALGEVYTTGGNSFGQLGHGNKVGLAVPTKLQMRGIAKLAFGGFSAALSVNGELLVWGIDNILAPKKVEGIQVKNMQVGSSFGVCVDDRGLVYSWGNNSSGELGLGDYIPRKELTHIISLENLIVEQIACGGGFCIVKTSNSPLLETKHTHHKYRELEQKYFQLVHLHHQTQDQHKLDIEKLRGEKEAIQQEAAHRIQMLETQLHALTNQPQRLPFANIAKENQLLLSDHSLSTTPQTHSRRSSTPYERKPNPVRRSIQFENSTLNVAQVSELRDKIKELLSKHEHNKQKIRCTQ